MPSRPEECISKHHFKGFPIVQLIFYLKFKNPVFEDKVIFSFFVKICKKFKFSESQHVALVPFAKTPQKLSLQKKNSRKSIISNNFRTKRKPQSQQHLILKSVIL